ncbi:MAG: biofilm-associated protein, partial [Candidatus Nitrosopumilus sp. metabat.KBP569_Feb_25m_nospike.7]
VSMFAESTFRVIPDKPNSGSTIRITGDQFAASQQFNFYIDTEKIGNFITDSKGHFVTTMQIPNIEKESRVDFKIIGHDEIEKKISLKLGEKTNRILGNENVRLEVRGIPDIVYQGDKVEIEGTGTPGKSIIIEIINPEKTTINSRITTIENTGTWKLLEPISIPLDAQFGEYSVSVSDGRNEILKKWTVKTNKVIIISPEKIQFDAGELIKFTGTAVPNIPIELILENNVGDEIASDIIEVADSGLVEFEYQTTENDDIEGTWTLIATQKNNKEFVYVGYDVFPTIPVNIKFDKINYKNTEKPIVSLAGIPSEKVSLIIITPSGSVVGSDITIQLKADGRGQHSLDLSGYVSGIYTAVVKKGGSQNSENFSVGLLSGSGQISSKITQTEYNQGERILLLGSTTNPNSLMTVTLTNPDGKNVKTLEIASNSEGMFSEERLKIPSDGKTGSWEIMIKSGSNLQKIQFDVFSEIKEGMHVKATEAVIAGDLLKIDITASHKTSIIVEISNAEGDKVQELMCNTTKEYKCETFWSIPKDTIPGTYNIKAYDSISSSETTFKVIMK